MYYERVLKHLLNGVNQSYLRVEHYKRVTNVLRSLMWWDRRCQLSFTIILTQVETGYMKRMLLQYGLMVRI